MPKTSTDLSRQVLNGPTMGTRWSVVLYAAAGFDLVSLQADLQAAVDEIDVQMSTWKPQSDLMRLNAAPVGEWVTLPERLLTVLGKSLEIGRISGGAFEIAMGDAITAWGFGPATADPQAIRAARLRQRRPSFETLALDLAGRAALKEAEMTLDLSGIAKGYGVDRLAELLQRRGIAHALAAIDGELRAIGGQPDGRGWAVAVERPDPETRTPHSMLEVRDIAIASSGDYRQWVMVGERRLSHTMNPTTGAPLLCGPAAVTVLAGTCIEADALASAFMVLGEDQGTTLARKLGIDALFLKDSDRTAATFSDF
ncbi:MAG: FAD:protein FMN transferase [Paracoccaceae bacterium]